MDYKSGLRDKPELVKVYEKISRGIWSYKGFFELLDANLVSAGRRKVFKFLLKPVQKKTFGRVVDLGFPASLILHNDWPLAVNGLLRIVSIFHCYGR